MFYIPVMHPPERNIMKLLLSFFLVCVLCSCAAFPKERAVTDRPPAPLWVYPVAVVPFSGPILEAMVPGGMDRLASGTAADSRTWSEEEMDLATRAASAGAEHRTLIGR
jgi:hypothetical protein